MILKSVAFHISLKEVEKIVQPLYTEMVNSDGKTPQALFTEEHKGLVKEGEKWMKGTAASSMVVATLIATVVFTAAFTLPGGQNNDKGIPFYLREKSFLAFVISDAIALTTSSTSILMFLSILTSRYTENDFLEELPSRLMLGLATLFVSITCMMVAFTTAFFISYQSNMLWVPIAIAVFACVPVTLFASLQFPLLADVIHSTYGSRYLFHPRKRMLF